MDRSSWAEDLAGSILSPLGRRWDHAQAVAEKAQQLASGLLAEEADVLVAAAYLHDIGYAPALAISGFHPLDGGRHLRRLGHERLATLVAHHTRARHEAHIRGLTSELAEFDSERTPVSAALAYCDVTTGPNGEDMTPEQRLVEVEARYGSNNPVTRGMRAAWPELMRDVHQVEGLLNRGTTVSQPT